ncbi:hypothetical protein PLESTB_001707600 [Pleodorina starrii]|uniref:Uncharacterized protein n=1 Tax=Pleodorina starrii TaxID=330485 RepID=A0A9W6BZA9_9CHLO|nr:hypothetical protein PLESTB_001707600 [Pleodorina starrii]GLC76615.1 hypothetical protein PLESTF_001805300 [Pleodorina starrii]
MVCSTGRTGRWSHCQSCAGSSQRSSMQPQRPTSPHWWLQQQPRRRQPLRRRQPPERLQALRWRQAQREPLRRQQPPRRRRPRRRKKATWTR